jgi:hypothetical protein
MSEVVKLKRGGQPGNRNARKHGFYADFLDDTQKQALKQAGCVKGLDQEIDLLRVKLNSAILHGPDDVGSISQLAASLLGLLRTRKQLKQHDNK